MQTLPRPTFTPLLLAGLLVLAGLSPLAGCSFGAAPKSEFFYYLSGPKAARDQGKGPRLSVGDFSAAPGYGTERIAYRVSDNELRYYAYRRWVSDPPKLLAEMLMRHVRASHRFSRVDLGDRVKSPMAVLDGSIDAIEELDKGNDTLARLAMTFVLRDATSDREIFHYAFDKTYPCAKRHPKEVAHGISKLLQLEAEKIAARIAHELK